MKDINTLKYIIIIHQYVLKLFFVFYVPINSLYYLHE